MGEREKFGSRIGFILVSAGCAIGLGNVWKFPYMCGQYGGAAFILIYLIFLAIMGFPILACEFAVGRASQRSVALSFNALEPAGSRWHNFKYFGMAGNYLLMMFYTTVAGWMMYYCYRCAAGEFNKTSLSAAETAEKFNEMLTDPGIMTFWMILVVVLAFGICLLGMRRGVEKITKVMMGCLLVLIAALAVNSLFLPGAEKGLAFYLVPDFDAIRQQGIGNVVFGAMSQAFFTLSIGIGAMAIFGSYLDKRRSLAGETIQIILLDTFVALMAGLIIIPACFSFAIEPDAGPSLIFITLPNIFNQMAGGRIWGSLFFLFMFFAALSTVVAVFENITAFAMDLRGWSRRKSVLVNGAVMLVLSMPCILGFNLLSGFMPLGQGTNIMDLEDFLVSNNLLPLGSLAYLLFCTSRAGWGWKNFSAEVNLGGGIKFPKALRGYMTYVLPVIIGIIYLKGYWDFFIQKDPEHLIFWMVFAVLLLVLVVWFAFGHLLKRKQESKTK